MRSPASAVASCGERIERPPDTPLPAAGATTVERLQRRGNMGKLEGQVALVTGSGRNIGRATVLKLAGEGAHVVVNARSNQAEADTVAREAQERGVRALAVIADVAS